MTAAGFTVMSLSLAFVLLLNVYCFGRVLRARRRPPSDSVARRQRRAAPSP
jgi:hypothetical protein